jgi:tripartite-type tricarboxylate transporter receptor subunit TctC
MAPIRPLVVATALVACFAAPLAQAQAWPSKPIRWINPFAAGGGTDVFARPLAARLSQQLGQQVVIENQGGAGGTLGAANAAKAPGDGYTWFVGAIHHTIAETIYTKLPYNLERDFIPVSVIAAVPNVVVVHPKHSFKSLQELIEFARKNPGALNFGSAGNGTSHHMAGELFKNLTKVNLTHVPYRGAGPMMQDLIAGQVDMAFDGMGTSAVQIKAGKLRPLAVTSGKRAPIVPDVPTTAELGFPNFQLTTWYGLWAVKGTPKEAVDRMHAETQKALSLPDVRQFWADQGAEWAPATQADFGRFVSSEIARWGKVVREAGLKIDL